MFHINILQIDTYIETFECKSLYTLQTKFYNESNILFTNYKVYLHINICINKNTIQEQWGKGGGGAQTFALSCR